MFDSSSRGWGLTTDGCDLLATTGAFLESGVGLDAFAEDGFLVLTYFFLGLLGNGIFCFWVSSKSKFR